ncbi:hypothetical protein D3C83_214440 [compost metagenome]
MRAMSSVPASPTTVASNSSTAANAARNAMIVDASKANSAPTNPARTIDAAATGSR